MHRLYVPTKVIWGRDIVKETLEREDTIKGNVLIVTTGRSLKKNGYIDELVKLIEGKQEVEKIYVFDEISANPDIEEIQKCTEKYAKNEINLVIGFGGGSSIDASKVVAAALGMNVTAYELWGGVVPDVRTLPLIAMPTTAGTGSELSKAAIVSDRRNKKKGGIRGEALYPNLAIVDSKYTESIPVKISMETGFDVLAHAIESYVSLSATSYTRMLSKEAIRIVRDYLMVLREDPQNIEARKQMSYASMIMGINLGNASTALPHRLQYPLGANTKSSHGAGLAGLYPAWIKNAYEVYPDKIDDIYEIMFEKKPASNVEAASLIKEFINHLGLDVEIRSLGVDEQLAREMSKQVTGNIANDPLSEVNDIISIIYSEAIK